MEQVLISFLMKYGAQAGQNSIYIIIMGYCVMKVFSLSKDKSTMSEALKTKTDKEMCKQKHSDLDKHMDDLKKGNSDISSKIDNLVNVLLTRKEG